MKLHRLNLPPFKAQLSRNNNSTAIWDRLRKRFISLTPEEWVRQHFVNYLIEYLHYPQGLIGNEISLTLNNTTRRCDTIVYDSEGKPWMIIEYKAPDIPLTRTVVEQALRYNIILQARYITLCNGLTIHCCSINPDGTIQPLQQLPQHNT